MGAGIATETHFSLIAVFWAKSARTALRRANAAARRPATLLQHCVAGVLAIASAQFLRMSEMGEYLGSSPLLSPEPFPSTESSGWPGNALDAIAQAPVLG